jgi:hypothetical protein
VPGLIKRLREDEEDDDDDSIFLEREKITTIFA